MYVEVLDALVLLGSMRLARITYKTNLSYSLLKPILEDLIKNELVEERRLKKTSLSTQQQTRHEERFEIQRAYSNSSDCIALQGKNWESRYK